MKKAISEKIVYSLDQVPRIAQKLKELLNTCSVMTFTGSLGTGKTTLVQELLKQSGIQDRVTSPTFTYFNQYTNDRGTTFYHFDLYRINSLDDFRAAGFDEYLYEPKSVALIEWPEHIMPLLKNNICHVTLDYHGDPSKRVIMIECR
jgi:tRNA threonylcarbamoyladenosine biosynthesis protein TsaE